MVTFGRVGVLSYVIEVPVCIRVGVLSYVIEVPVCIECTGRVHREFAADRDGVGHERTSHYLSTLSLCLSSGVSYFEEIEH